MDSGIARRCAIRVRLGGQSCIRTAVAAEKRSVQMLLSLLWDNLLAFRVKRMVGIDGVEEELDTTELDLRREVKGEDVLWGFRG